MAFNPFTWFRKNQKALFAGLLILCMIVFVGSFGAGDPFQVAINYFGASRAAGPEVTRLYKRVVHLDEVDQVKRRRELANGFLRTTIPTSHTRVSRSLLANELKSASPDNVLSGVRELVTRLSEYPRQMQMAYFRGREFFPIEQLRIQESLQNDLAILETIAAREAIRKEPEYLETLRRVATMTGFLIWALGDNTGQGNLYMGGSTTRLEDRLDFLVWKTQADRLGIQLTDADVLRQIEIEAAGDDELFPNKARTPPVQQKALVEYALAAGGEGSMRQRVSELIDALRQEFRVAMAQSILLGAEPGARAFRNRLGALASPAVGTPQEFFTFFKDQRTTLKAAFLPIPVSSFLPQIKATPSEAELLALYNRFKDREPSPSSIDPGFKEPRRIVVEFVSASPEDPFYKDQAGKQIQALKALSDAKNQLGIGLAALTKPILARALVGFDPVRIEYERDLANDQPWLSSDRDSLSTLEQRLRSLHYGSVVKPAPLAALFLGTRGLHPLVGLTSLYGAANAEEIRSSVQFATGLLLRGGGVEDSLGRAALALTTNPPPPSQSTVEPQLLHALQERIAQNMLDNNIRALAMELNRLRGRPAALREYLTQAVKDFHFEFQSMKQPQTRDALQEAAQAKNVGPLEPLRQAIASTLRQSRAESFVDELFRTVGTYEAQGALITEPRRREFVFWRSEDLPARERPFKDVRQDVLAAWKLDQARLLASKRAEGLRAEINNKKLNPTDALRFLREQKDGSVFELENIAQLLPPREVLAMPNVEYRPYQVPEEFIDRMRFPPSDLPKQLLQIKEVGQSRVVADQPVRNFWVAVLLERNVPSQAEFRNLYARTPRDTLYNRFVSQRREDFRKNLIQQLRAEAAGGREQLDREGRFKVSEAARRSETTEVE